MNKELAITYLKLAKVNTELVVFNRYFQITAAAAASGAAGFVLGNRKAVRDIQKGVDQMFEENASLTNITTVEDIEVPLAERLSPEQLTEALSQSMEILEDEGYLERDDHYSEWELEYDAIDAIEEDEDENGEPVIDNVFAGSDDAGWDYETELALRDPATPYTIHVDEYTNDEMNYHQSTVVFYAGDSVMADDADNNMYGWEQMMGELNFGHGSKDQNAVYIRNERLMLEWEVLRHTGSYETEVGGLEIEEAYEAQDELRHSRNLRMRDDQA